MRVFLILLSILSIQDIVKAVDLIEISADVAIKLWEKINTERKETPLPKLVIRFGKKQKPLRLDKLLQDPANKARGPFSFVYDVADKLTKNKDMENCDIYWYDDGDQMLIDDNDSLVEAIEAGADLKGNKRLIDVICEAEEVNKQLQNAGLEYRKAKVAYDYALLTKFKPVKSAQQTAEKSLKEANLGGYELEAEGVGLFDLKGEEFQKQAMNVAAAYEWGPKQIALLTAATSGSRTSGARSYVKFDPTTWKIVGSFSRLYAWESVSGRYSMYCATSTFKFSVPKTERQGNFKERYWGGEGGTIKQEFIDLIKTVLEYRAIEESEKKLDEPEEGLFDLKKEI